MPATSLGENVPLKTVNRMDLNSGANALTINSELSVESTHVRNFEVTAQTNTRSYLASSYLGSDRTQTSEPTLEHLPSYSPVDESYMLNGIIKQVPINRPDLERLFSTQESSHLFVAKRLVPRKKVFQLNSQLSFHLNILSSILITPFTVAIIQKTEDIRQALQD